MFSDIEAEFKSIKELIYEMLEDGYMEYIIMNEKVTPGENNTWTQCKEKIKKKKENYDRLLVVYEKVSSPELEKYYEIKELIHFVYDRMLSLEIKINKSEKEQIFTLWIEGAKDIQSLCKWLYAQIEKKNIKRRTESIKKKRPNAPTLEITDAQGEKWEILETYKEEFMNCTEEQKETLLNKKKVGNSIFISEEEKVSQIKEYQMKIIDLRKQLSSRASTIKTFQEFAAFLAALKNMQEIYGWLLNAGKNRNPEEKDETENYLDFFIQCLEVASQNHQTTLPEEELPILMYHLETLSIAYDINEKKGIFEKITQKQQIPEEQTIKIKDFLGKEYKINCLFKAAFQKLENEQIAFYDEYTKAMNYINTEITDLKK